MDRKKIRKVEKFVITEEEEKKKKKEQFFYEQDKIPLEYVYWGHIETFKTTKGTSKLGMFHGKFEITRDCGIIFYWTWHIYKRTERNFWEIDEIKITI